MAALICCFSALVSFFALDNLLYLLIQFFLPHYGRIEVVGFVWPLLRADKADLHDIADDFFQRLSVLLIHGEHEKRQHDKHHEKGCRTAADVSLDEEKDRKPNQKSSAEADDLALGQVEGDLGFDCVHILGYGYICHSVSTSLMCVEHALCQRAGLEQREAQQHGVTHNRPDCHGDIALHDHVLHKDGINCHADDD